MLSTAHQSAVTVSAADHLRGLVALAATAVALVAAGCGSGQTAGGFADGPVDGTYAGSVTVGTTSIPVSFTVSGNGMTVGGLTFTASAQTCSGGDSWAAGSTTLPELGVGSDHTFRAHADGDDIRSPLQLGGDRSVELLGHLDGHGFAQGAVRLSAGNCGFEGSWTATDAGATATRPTVSDGEYTGHSVVFHRDPIHVRDNHPEVVFSVTSGGHRATGVKAGVFSECAGEGAYILRIFPDADIDSTGAFTTASAAGLKLTGHLDSDGVAVGTIHTPPPAGRCNDDGSTWEATHR